MNIRIDSKKRRRFFQMFWPVMLPALGVLAALGALFLSGVPFQSGKYPSDAQLHIDSPVKTVLGISQTVAAPVPQHG